MNLASIIKLISKIGFLFHYYIIILCLFVKFFITKFYYFFTFKSAPSHLDPLQKSHPHVFVNYDDLIKREGYSFQTYEAETQDNAFVTLWRIRRKNFSKSSYPVLIQHGLLDCSMSWFLHQDLNQSLPYILANEGYDVWLGNNRGTKHSSKNSQKKDYWNFSLDHFIKYDQPALINKVIQQTKKQKIIYIGHSQGSTQFIYGIEQNKYLQKKIDKFFGFGVVTGFQSLENHQLLNTLSKYNCLQILEKIGFKSILILPDWMNKKVAVLVYNVRFYFEVIMNFIIYLCGKTHKNNINTERLGIMVAHQPGGTSIRSVMQWVQAYRNGKIRKYDYGKIKNQQIYGTSQPPQYSLKHLKNVQFKSYIFKGKKDAVISQLDFQNMKNHFHQEKIQVFDLQDYAHLDYAWSTSAKHHIYDEIVKILTQSDDLNVQQMKTLDQTSQSSQSSNSFLNY